MRHRLARGFLASRARNRHPARKAAPWRLLLVKACGTEKTVQKRAEFPLFLRVFWGAEGRIIRVLPI